MTLKTKNVGQALILYWRYNFGLHVSDLAKRIDVVPATIFAWKRTGKISERHWKKIKEVAGFDCRLYVNEKE